MPVISAILAVLKIVSLFDKWFPYVLRLFQKDPVKQIQEAEKEHEDAAKKAEMGDDTSGSFRG